MLGWLGAALIVVAVMHLMMVIILACHPRAGHVVTLAAVTSAAIAGCEADAYLAPGHLQAAGAAAAAAVAVTVVYGRMSRGLHPAGAAVWSGWLLLGGVLLVWGAVFLAQLKVSPVTSWLLWATTGLSAVTLPSSVIQTREGWELLLRRRWRRAGQPPSHRFRGYPPMVSVHVPCHAEPPHIVIATLNRLARLDYPDFEVLVIDNNTTDPQLWQPVAAHCARLGPRFRFFHVEGMTGAKAGALNWVLPRTCPRAELIAVVDADYQVRPDWLRATVGYFADPGIGWLCQPRLAPPTTFIWHHLAAGSATSIWPRVRVPGSRGRCWR